jgi:hypothetical protein
MLAIVVQIVWRQWSEISQIFESRVGSHQTWRRHCWEQPYLRRSRRAQLQFQSEQLQKEGTGRSGEESAGEKPTIVQWHSLAM